MLGPLIADAQGALAILGLALLKVAAVAAVVGLAVWYFGVYLGGIEKLTGRKLKFRYVPRPSRRRKYGLFVDMVKVPGGSAFDKAGQLASPKYGAASLAERQLMVDGRMAGAMFDIFHDLPGEGGSQGVMSYSDDPNDERNYPQFRQREVGEFGDEDLEAEQAGEFAFFDAEGAEEAEAMASERAGEAASLDSAGL